MRTLFATMAAAAIFVGAALAPTAAGAQERLTDGAFGALAGAVVGGPVGAVAGGVIGYTNGPRIATAMGLRHPRYHHYANREGGNGNTAH
ncbi:MAG TPA: hypothetical protein VKT73_04515 [Xanthobacteraceae bacterium]|nr:hypothetical protein [Xanthobacteraceae bacterium]